MTRKKLKLIVTIIVFMLYGCGATEDQQRIANSAITKIQACENIGEASFEIIGKTLVWNIEEHSLHAAHKRLPDEMIYETGESNVTVFLVTEKKSVQVGTYSISGEPAYRQWVDIYVVQAPEMKPIGAHTVVSLYPRARRPVRHSPEFGNPIPPIVEWIKSLPRK